VGIAVSGRANVLIVGGTVRNFATGVLLSDATGVVIRGNRFVANNDGVDNQAGSIGNTIIENHFQDHGTRGVMLRGGTSANLVKENTFTGNRVGVLMFGPAATTVKENTISFSTLAGIRINVLATGNLVAENTISSNPAGIDFIGAAPGNTLRENTLNLNGCGLRGPSAGNTLAENVFLENAVDICP